MRLSDAKSHAREIIVSFEGGDLHVSYRPMSYTVEELDRLGDDAAVKDMSAEERKARIGRIIEMITQVVASWDLTEDDGETPIDPADTVRLRSVPINVFTEILAAIRKDQRPDPEA